MRRVLDPANPADAADIRRAATQDGREAALIDMEEGHWDEWEEKEERDYSALRDYAVAAAAKVLEDNRDDVEVIDRPAFEQMYRQAYADAYVQTVRFE
jgi:hypothetical protein